MRKSLCGECGATLGEIAPGLGRCPACSRLASDDPQGWTQKKLAAIGLAGAGDDNGILAAAAGLVFASSNPRLFPVEKALTDARASEIQALIKRTAELNADLVEVRSMRDGLKKSLEDHGTYADVRASALAPIAPSSRIADARAAAALRKLERGAEDIRRRNPSTSIIKARALAWAADPETYRDYVESQRASAAAGVMKAAGLPSEAAVTAEFNRRFEQECSVSGYPSDEPARAVMRARVWSQPWNRSGVTSETMDPSDWRRSTLGEILGQVQS